jgi:hypothetical protein
MQEFANKDGIHMQNTILNIVKISPTNRQIQAASTK